MSGGKRGKSRTRMLTLGTPIFRPLRGKDMSVEDQLLIWAAVSRTSVEMLVGSFESYCEADSSELSQKMGDHT